MIRINLGRTRIQNVDSLESAYQAPSSSSGDSSPVGILIKLIAIFIGLLALNFYEGSNLEKLNAQVAQVNQQLMTLQTTLEQKNQELASLGSLQDDSKVLQDKMALLKGLSQLRLREVKSLDYLQTIIPPRVWLTTLNIDKDQYVFKGRSKDEAAVSLFVEKLEDGGYFSDVVLIQDSPIVEQGVDLREFEVLARSEVVN